MPSLLRAALVVSLVSGAVAAVAVTGAKPASASVPGPITVTQTAARGDGIGESADVALVNADTVTTAPDGSVLYYDTQFHQIRRVDATTRTISLVAGSGSILRSGSIDTTALATAAALPTVDRLWADAAGDVFALMCEGSNCGTNHDLYRLDASDGRWHLAVFNSWDPTNLSSRRFYWFAVATSGAVFAVAEGHEVIRRFDVGADPTSAGTIVAGQLDSAGSSGDGGPATSAKISPTGPIAVSAGGDVYFADGGWGTKIRHVAADGTISTLTDPGASTSDPGNPPTITALTVSADSAAVYIVRNDSYPNSVLRAIPADGTTPHTVAAPQTTCNSAAEACLGTSITEAPFDGTTSVLTAAGSIDAWPADGSQPHAYNRYAGILNDAKGARSPDGTPLSKAYVDPYSLAVAPSGSLAIAGYDGIYSLSGLQPNSTFSTVVPDVAARSLQYAADGTLYGIVADPTPHVVAVAPGAHTATTILGGGSNAVADGATGTDVALPWDAKYAVDPATGAVVFDTATGAVWRLDPATHLVHPLGNVTTNSSDPAALTVAPDHSVLVAANGGLTSIASDGTVSTLDCSSGCPTSDLHVLADGTIVGTSDLKVILRAPNGAMRQFGNPVFSIFALTGDNRFIVPANNGLTGGLLAVSDPFAAPTAQDPPSVNAYATAGTLHVDVTPSVAGQRVRIYADALDANGHNLDRSVDLVDDSVATTADVTSQHSFPQLFSVWPNRPGTGAPANFRVRVVASEDDGANGDEIVNPAQVFNVSPVPDTVAPAAPTVHLTNNGRSVSVTVGRPADADFDRVIVCRTTDGSTPTGPWGCPDYLEVPSYGTNPAAINDSVDPLAITTYTAFALDSSSNASAPVTVTRPAARLVSGAAATHVGYDAQGTDEEVTWDGSATTYVRYALGARAPATITDGTAASWYSGVFGLGTRIPVAKGAMVAVSVFGWADDKETTFRRSSFVVTGGTNSDTLRLSATPTVSAAAAPTVTASVTRTSPTEGSIPLAAVAVYLYRRAVGTSSWTYVRSGRTGSHGTVALAVPAQNAATEYRASYYPLNSTSSLLSSKVVRTAVRQAVSASLPTRIADGHAVTVRGTVSPHRVATVSLQRYSGGRWSTIASARTSTSGAYRIGFTPRTRGTWTLRVTVAATSTLLAGTTSTRKLVVN